MGLEACGCGCGCGIGVEREGGSGQQRIWRSLGREILREESKGRSSAERPGDTPRAHARMPA